MDGGKHIIVINIYLVPDLYVVMKRKTNIKWVIRSSIASFL